MDELEAASKKLGIAPAIGTARPELAAGIRMWPHGRYLIFYREQRGHLRIERILHSALDVSDDDFNPMDSDN